MCRLLLFFVSQSHAPFCYTPFSGIASPWPTEIAAIFCDLRLRCPSRTPQIARFPRQETAMMHCDLRVRWKVASDLRFRAAISEPETPSFCGISGDLTPSTRTSLAIAIVRFWWAKCRSDEAGQKTQRFLAPKVSSTLMGSLAKGFLQKVRGKFAEICTKYSQPQSITQKGVHARLLTAREREHWFLQHLSHLPATNFGRQ